MKIDPNRLIDNGYTLILENHVENRTLTIVAIFVNGETSHDIQFEYDIYYDIDINFMHYVKDNSGHSNVDYFVNNSIDDHLTDLFWLYENKFTLSVA